MIGDWLSISNQLPDYPITRLPDADAVITYRDLTTLEDFAAVVDLEREIWGPGYDEVVPVPILAVTVMRGGILIGAFVDDARRLSVADGRFRLLAARHQARQADAVVAHGGRARRVPRAMASAVELKLLQRERALAMGLELIEWTYDPMQAMNAHLNFAKLGVVAEEYEVNVYGDVVEPAAQGQPDRSVRRGVADRRDRTSSSGCTAPAPLAPVLTVEPAIAARPAGEWLEPAAIDLALDARRVSVEIPIGFTEMLSEAPDLALEWRMATRESLHDAISRRGYRAVEFFLDREARKGTYLLIRN